MIAQSESEQVEKFAKYIVDNYQTMKVQAYRDALEGCVTYLGYRKASSLFELTTRNQKSLQLFSITFDDITLGVFKGYIIIKYAGTPLFRLARYTL